MNTGIKCSMRKISALIGSCFILSLNFIVATEAKAEGLGGYAVVDPSTGIVHGVIVANSSDPFGNGGVMPHEYMGCPAGCVIVQQSTADQNGNVAGMHGPNITYDSNRNVFEVSQSNSSQSQTVTESASNTNSIETELSVSRSARNYEFGVQDLRNTNGQFQLTEVAPSQNTSARVSAVTTEYVCEESPIICSKRASISSTQISDESVSFAERATSVQVEEKVIAEAKSKIKEQISLILSMLERWLLD